MVPELRPRSVGEVLDVAVHLYRARFGPLMRVALVVVIPVSILSMFVLLSALPDEFTVGLSGDVTPVFDSDTDAALQIGAIVITTLLSALATALVTAVTTRIVADAYVGRDAALSGVVRATRSRLAAVIGLTIVVTVATTAGVAACIVPGIWLQVAWSVAIPVLILEGTPVFRSLGRSFALTKIRFWLAFGVFWLSQLLVLVLSAGLAAGLAWAIQSTDSPSADVIAQSVANAAATIVTVPFAATAIVALYFDLRIRAEAFDVQMMIARLDERRRAGLRPGVISFATVDPDSARDDVRQILEDRRYRSDPAPRPFRGPLQWLGDRLSTVGGWISDALRAVPWFVWLAVLVLAGVLATVWILRRVRRSRTAAGARTRPDGNNDAPDDPRALEREADLAERRGELERAVRLRFRAGLLRLGYRGAIEYRPALTTSEVRALLGNDTFDHLAETFERVAYGEQPAVAPDVADARANWPVVVEEARRR